jgi:type VI secretion system secreted protein VgrG
MTREAPKSDSKEHSMADPKNAPIPVGKVSVGRETVAEFRLKNELGPTHVSVREYDWTHSADEDKPKSDLGKGHESGYRRTIFHHSQGVEVGGYKRGRERAYTELYVEEQAEHLLEQAKVKQKTFSGTSNVITLRAGGKFALSPDPGARYLTAEARHVGIFPKSDYRESMLKSEEVMGREGYRNSFECLPMDVPFRPHARVPRPRIEGSLLATVVGPSSQDVHTDPHGRVRIRFHWDRKSKRVDSKRLCWARVAQAWAGKGFGTMFIPRIGMEVVVQFIEGDPDRPIVIGCVYNDVNYPPLTLEDDQTKSIICTRSSPQEDGKPLGFNSIEFEDMGDQELLSVHAQRDLKEEVLHDRSRVVKNDETVKVEKNQTITVGTGGANPPCIRKLAVHGKERIEVAEERDETVTKKVTQTFQAEHERVVKGPQNFTVEEDKIEHIKSAYELTTDKKFNLTQGSTSLTFAEQKVSLDAAGAVHVKRGPAEVTIDQSGKVVVSSPSGISLQCGSSKLELLPSGVEINGMKVACTAGASSLELGPASAKLSGPMSSVEGTATCSVKGLMVNVNS